MTDAAAASSSLDAHGAMRLIAGMSVRTLAEDPAVPARYPLLAQAALVELAQHDDAARWTLADALQRRPHCGFLLEGHRDCLKAGGAGCPAREQGSHDHAIFDTGPCWAVQPSDLAVALTALEATAHLDGIGGARSVAFGTLYDAAATEPAAELSLAAGERLVAVTLPAASAGGIQCYLRADGDAFVSLAACKRADDEVRLVFGGVAAGPFRGDDRIEEDLSVGGVDDESLDALAERAMYDATPLAGSAFKVELAQALLRRAGRVLDPR